MAYSSNSSTGSHSTGSTASIGSSIGSNTSGSGTPSNSNGSQTSNASIGSNTSGSGTPSNSNGNFRGGLPGLGGGSWNSPASETEAAHASGVQGPGLANGDFGSSWSGNGNYGSGSGDYTYNNTSYSNNKSEPVMTVDEVYGKNKETGVNGNQSKVESQGDYTASSNEKSNVETSTFGKQDDITVTPESITENKGLVNNEDIESVEGLNFQQKDKKSQDVMEARKSRDDAEAEDKSNQMRDSLKAKTEQTDEEDANDFQIGEEAASKEKADLDEATKTYDDLKSQADSKLAEFNEATNKYAKAQEDYNVANRNVRDQTAKVDDASDNEPGAFEPSSIITLKDGSEITILTYKGKDPNVKADNDARNKAINELSKADAQYYEAKAQYDAAKADYNQYVTSYNEAKANLDRANEAYNNKFVASEKNDTSDTKQMLDNAIQKAVEKGADEKSVQEMTDIATSIDESQTEMKNAIEANDIPAYIEAQKQYNKNLNKALQISNRLTQTDFNKDFVAAVAKANDFEVTLADGTKTTYSQFATDIATKSPEVAKAMYEAKANEYEENNHPILAKIERAKAEMVGTWIGSKLTMADNQVRNQFIQMAKTDMRATYAAYNNVLSDPNATPEAKAEASAAINQANALMTASAALQASTGFLSGIGDSMRDGVYGTTDPTTLNAYQKTLNAVDNFINITLGLGVSPGANKAYQNMYYMAGAKVNESGLFGRDFDSDGFALCQEYGNSAAAGMIAGAGELATGVALFFNPAMISIGLNLVIDSVQTFTNGLYGVQKGARKSQQYTQEILSYFNKAQSIAADTGNKEVINAMNATMSNAVKQIENFELKSDEVGNLDNWLEGSGSNTATNEKFNQSLTYDEWLKLIEADPTMRDYAKKLIAEKKEK